jgi:hypothetical protein
MSRTVRPISTAATWSDGADLALLPGYWGQAGPTDLNDDGITSGADLTMLLGAWGNCP